MFFTIIYIVLRYTFTGSFPCEEPTSASGSSVGSSAFGVGDASLCGA